MPYGATGRPRSSALRARYGQSLPCRPMHDIRRMSTLATRIKRRLRGDWDRLRVRLYLRKRVSGRIKLRGNVNHLSIDPSFRCDGDLWLGVYSDDGCIVIEADVSASGPLTITAIRQLRVGAGTLFGPNVFVTDHYHGDRHDASHINRSPSSRPLHSPGPVEIGQNVLLGVNSVVLAPALVGNNTIIAANAVVKGTIAPNSVHIGLARR